MRDRARTKLMQYSAVSLGLGLLIAAGFVIVRRLTE
jgi:hypothetical protein